MTDEGRYLCAGKLPSGERCNEDLTAIVRRRCDQTAGVRSILTNALRRRPRKVLAVCSAGHKFFYSCPIRKGSES